MPSPRGLAGSFVVETSLNRGGSLLLASSPLQPSSLASSPAPGVDWGIGVGGGGGAGGFASGAFGTAGNAGLGAIGALTARMGFEGERLRA